MGSYWGFARGFGTAATVALIGSPLLLLRFHTSSGRPGSRTPTQARVGASAVQSAEGLLQARCASCHSPAERAGGLDLSTPGALLRGGQSGPVVQSGDPEASRLWRRVAGREAPVMPPTGARFTSAEQELLREWIRSEPSPVLPGKSDPAEAGRPVGAPWAFRPLRPVEPPAVQNENWLRNPVDRFLLAELETRKLQPAPEAERTVLLRRVTQDLIGLPPSLPERDAFLADTAPGAYERVVERLLASPHYGERWGRHWLDLASYGDSSGYEADWDRPGAYAYRDFVIRALNQDLPYNTFLRWQLAGDLLEPALPLARAATGFCTSGATISPGYDRKARYEELDDVVSTTGSAMLGLTLGCARCHDHKFDPISQRDYYRLVAVFASSRRTVRTEPAGDGWPGGKLLALEEGPAAASYFLAHGNVEDEAAGERVPPGVPAALTRGTPFPLGGGAAPRVGLAEWITDTRRGAGALAARVAVNWAWQHHFGRGLVAASEDFGARADAPSHPDLLEWLAGRFVEGWSLKKLHRLLVTSAVYRQGTAAVPETARRDPENRWWGRREPLRLEAEAVRDGMLAVSGCLNRTLYGPSVRPWIPDDAIHKTESKYAPRWPQGVQDGPATWRRSIYVTVKRSNPMPLLQAFDQLDAAASCARRPTTTVAPQALALMNDLFVRDQSVRLAERAVREGGATPEARIGFLYRTVLGRAPAEAELRRGMAFLRAQGRGPGSGSGAAPPDRQALTNYCQVLFWLNDFLYVE